MSAGNFISTIYSDAEGRFYRIRLQPETLALTIATVPNAAGAGPVDQPVSARARGSRRSIGVTARKVALRFTSTLPTGYSGDPVEVPVLTPAAFAAYLPGLTGTYLGSDVEVISRTNEQLR